MAGSDGEASGTVWMLEKGWGWRSRSKRARRTQFKDSTPVDRHRVDFKKTREDAGANCDDETGIDEEGRKGR